jgi:hypothetical protein
MSPSRTYEHPHTDDITIHRVLFALSEPLRFEHGADPGRPGRGR